MVPGEAMTDKTTYEAVPRATIKGFDRVLRVRTVGDVDPVRIVETAAYTKGLPQAQLVAAALNSYHQRQQAEVLS